MPKLTFYPIGNADTILIDLDNGKKVLFDFADMRNPDDQEDKRIDLSAVLREDLEDFNRTGYDIFAVTHLDNDHTRKADEFFYLDHAEKYQKGDRAKIDTMWVPASVITESRNKLKAGARALQAEARYRLVNDYGIRVFSRPEVARAWLEDQGIDLEDREHLFTDAGQVIPGLSVGTDGVEFFAHSPFAWRRNEDDVEDRNGNSLVVQATFVVDEEPMCVLLGSDVDYEALSLIVQTTRRKDNEARLLWDIFKLPHHSSYLTLSDERGEDKTEPGEDVAWLFEEQGRLGGLIVSTSKPIPAKGSDEDESIQPPHRQAANYYRRAAQQLGGQYVVTMEYPNVSAPEPFVIDIAERHRLLEEAEESDESVVAASDAPPPMADDRHSRPLRWPESLTHKAVLVGGVYPRIHAGKKLWDLTRRSVPKSIGLRFQLRTNATGSYTVWWQVTNTGREATEAHQLRGEFYESDSPGGSVRWEATAYAGTHWVEGFVVKGGICVARTGRNLVRVRR